MKIVLHVLFIFLAYASWWAWIIFDWISLGVSCVCFIVLLLISELLVTSEIVVGHSRRIWILSLSLAVHAVLMPLCLLIWITPPGMISVLLAISLLAVSRKRCASIGSVQANKD